MGRWYRQGADCPVLAQRDPDLLFLFHWLKSTAKSIQLRHDATRSMVANGTRVSLESGQVLVFPRQMTRVLGRRFSRTKVTRLLARLEALGEVSLQPIQRVGTVVNLAHWLTENPVDSMGWVAQPGSVPGVWPANQPGSGPDKSAQGTISAIHETTNRASKPTRSEASNRATDITVKNGNGKEEEGEKSQTGETDETGPPPPHEIQEWTVKAGLESVAQDVLGRLWFATELGLVTKLLPVARTVGMDALRAAWRKFLETRRSKDQKIRLAWFMDHVNEYLETVALVQEDEGQLRPHLQALVLAGTITEAEAAEIQEGRDWVDPNDILAHIARRRETTPITEVTDD